MFRGWRAYSHFSVRDARDWDVDVLKGIELPRLQLSGSALDWDDTHQHRLRLAHDLVVDDIQVDKERLNNVQGGGTISEDF